MATSSNAAIPTVPGLVFTRYIVKEIGSVAFPFKGRKEQELTGVYILEFENGERYVGQALNVVRRVANHRRRWPDLYALEFAQCPAHELNQFEQRTISHQERCYTLRNKSITNLPGGPGEFTVSVEEEGTLELPSSRNERRHIRTDAPRAREKFWELLRLPVYEEELIPLVGRYLNETVSDPIGTQRYLWTISALPATNKRRGERRITTISCGNLETLVIAEWKQEDWVAYGGFVNIAAEILTEDHLRRIDAVEGVLEIMPARYRQRQDVIAVHLENLEAFHRLLDLPEVLDAAYRLNVGLMRQGATMYRRFHNEHLANDIINAAGAFGY